MQGVGGGVGRSDESGDLILGREGETEYQLGRLSVKVRSYKERVPPQLQCLTEGWGSRRGGGQEKRRSHLWETPLGWI